MAPRVLVAFAVLSVTIAIPAAAQTAPSERTPAQSQRASALPKAFVHAAFGTDLSNGSFNYDVTFPLFAETARISTAVDLGHVLEIELGAGLRIWKRIGVGVSWVRSSADGTLESAITLPYPFLFGEGRTTVATTSSHQSRQDVHIEGLFALHHSSTWLVVLSGGPSVTWIDQELSADRLRIAYLFPFEEIAVAERSDGATSGRGNGGHVGMSVMRRLGTHIGIEGRTRWSGTSVQLEDRDGHPVSVDVGGLSMGVGIRFVF